MLNQAIASLKYKIQQGSVTSAPTYKHLQIECSETKRADNEY